MTESEMLESARRAVRNPKPSSAVALDRAALEAATGMPVVVDLGSIVDFLSGASTSGNKANNYFTRAADQSGQYYGNALDKLVSSTGSGSPAATTFGNEEAAALQPQFQRQQQQLAARNAAQGITNSGSGNYNNQQLAADQSATLAGAIAPLYSTAMSQYGTIAGNQAGQQSGLVGQGAGEANQAYGNAIQQFYNAAETAGTGMPVSGGSQGNQYANWAQSGANPYSSNPYEQPNGSVQVSGGSNPYAAAG